MKCKRMHICEDFLSLATSFSEKIVVCCYEMTSTLIVNFDRL